MIRSDGIKGFYGLIRDATAYDPMEHPKHCQEKRKS